MIKIKLKDNSELEVEEGLSIIEIAKKISEGLARMATCAEIDGEVVDLRTVVEKDCSLNILTFESSLNGKKAYWHTTSHIMAQAIKRLYPEIKLAIGPSIDNGFYYDFDTEKPFTPEMLEAIEKEMKKIIKEDLPLERFELPRKEAIKFMEEKEEPYKVELINDLPEDAIISFYKRHAQPVRLDRQTGHQITSNSLITPAGQDGDEAVLHLLVWEIKPVGISPGIECPSSCRNLPIR